MKVRNRVAEYMLPMSFFIVSLTIWQTCVPARITSYLIPTPLSIAKTAFQTRGMLGHNLYVTMAEAVCGFLLANSLAFALAVWSSYSRTAERIVYPYAIALKTAPIVALAPLLVVWFGTGKLSKVIAASLICFFPLLINCIRGLRRVDPEAVDLFRSLGADEMAIFLKLRLPSSLPYIFSALKISSSLSIVGAIVGEFVGAQEGLGYVITISSYHFEVAEMFAAVLAATTGGLCFFVLIGMLERITTPWGESESDSM